MADAENPDRKFVETSEIKDIMKRSVAYLKAGYPVHLRGPAGIGKTTLAIQIAHSIGRPVVTIFGNDEVNLADFLGGQFGYRKRAVVDNFVHSVMKSEELVEQQWEDGRIIDACKDGYTLIYDEFSRSTPEVNNFLLSVLEERILQLPFGRKGEKFIKVHPEFRAIFTSNPNEYAGVHKTQEALLDRMITINLEHWDRESEIRITAAKTGLDQESAEKIIEIIRNYREETEESRNVSLRSAIMLGNIVRLLGMSIDHKDRMFVKVCKDILGGRYDKYREVRINSLM